MIFFITDFAKIPSTASKLRIKSTATAVSVLFFQSTDGTGTKKVPRYCPPMDNTLWLLEGIKGDALREKHRFFDQKVKPTDESIFLKIP